MKADTTRLTVRLPTQDVEFAKAYAKEHGITVTEMIDRYLRRMRAHAPEALSTEVRMLSGLVPPEVDVKAEERRHLLGKHQ